MTPEQHAEYRRCHSKKVRAETKQAFKELAHIPQPKPVSRRQPYEWVHHVTDDEDITDDETEEFSFKTKYTGPAPPCYEKKWRELYHSEQMARVHAE